MSEDIRRPESEDLPKETRDLNRRSTGNGGSRGVRKGNPGRTEQSWQKQPARLLNIGSRDERGLQPRITTVDGQINGQAVTCLIDSGASANFLTEDLAIKLSRAEARGEENPVRMPDGSQQNSYKMIDTVQLQLGQQHREDIQFNV